jgi:hypothetical protein
MHKNNTPKNIFCTLQCTETILPNIYSARCNAQKQYSQIYPARCNAQKQYSQIYILHVAIHKNNTPKYIFCTLQCTKTILPNIFCMLQCTKTILPNIYLHVAMHKNNTPKYILHVAICTITKTMWPVCSRLLQAPSDYHIPSNYAVPVALYTGTVAGVLRAASSPLNIISSHCIQLCSACCTVHRHCGWCAEGCLQPSEHHTIPLYPIMQCLLHCTHVHKHCGWCAEGCLQPSEHHTISLYPIMQCLLHCTQALWLVR